MDVEITEDLSGNPIVEGLNTGYTSWTGAIDQSEVVFEGPRDERTDAGGGTTQDALHSDGDEPLTNEWFRDMVVDQWRELVLWHERSDGPEAVARAGRPLVELEVIAATVLGYDRAPTDGDVGSAASQVGDIVIIALGAATQRQRRLNPSSR